jgi:hypothetical protein
MEDDSWIKRYGSCVVESGSPFPKFVLKLRARPVGAKIVSLPHGWIGGATCHFQAVRL